jgi:asparagine synthase (glutamine-hydrolysing)
MKEDQDLHYSMLLSAHLGAKSDHRIIETGASEITLEQIDKIIDLAHLIDDSRLLSIYRNYELVKDLGFKVVLNGQGADELMGGYAGLPVFYNNLLGAENENLLAENMLNLSALSNPLIFNKNIQERKELLKEDIMSFFQNINAPVDEKIHRYLMKSTLQRILKFVDHLIMLNSVECRLPYLDYRLVEWTFSKTFAIHIDFGLKQGKSLLRKVASKYLPAQLAERPKQTFPSIDPVAGKKILENIIIENFDEICRNSTICFLYILKGLDVSRFTFNELWQLIVTWRWSKKLDNIASISRKDRL